MRPKSPQISPISFSHLVRSLHYSGIFNSVVHLIKFAVPSHWFDIEYFKVFECELPNDGADINSISGVRWATPDDMDVLVNMQRFRKLGASWLAEGARAIVMQEDDKIVGCLWIATSDHNQDDWMTFKLSPDEAWTITIWVHPDYRGRGYHGRIWAFGTSALAGEGRRRLLCHIDVLNRRSMRAFRKVNVSPIEGVFLLRFFGWTLVTNKRRTRLGHWNEHRRFQICPGSKDD